MPHLPSLPQLAIVVLEGKTLAIEYRLHELFVLPVSLTRVELVRLPRAADAISWRLSEIVPYTHVLTSLH